MLRMTGRLQRTQQIHHIERWSPNILHDQIKYAYHILRSPIKLWSRMMRTYNVTSKIDRYSPHLPYRSQGRPLLRWDDHLRRFCEFM